MSEHLLRFLVSELKLVRVRCKGPTCGMTFEMPVKALVGRFPQSKCPLCGHMFQWKTVAEGDPLTDLAVAILRLAGDEDKVEVQFVLPESPADDEGK